MVDRSTAPADFVSYVVRRLPVLDHAAQRLVGGDLRADRLSRELLTLVALRWWWLTRNDSRHSLAAGRSADLHLSRLFHSEAAELGYAGLHLDLDATVPAPRRAMGRLSLQDDAQLMWDTARQRVRRRLIIAAFAGTGIAVAALCRRGGGFLQADDSPTAQARATVLPTGAERAPADVSSTFIVRGLPREVTLPDGHVNNLSVDPVRRALLVVATSRSDTSAVLVLGTDGRWRRIDRAPPLAALWLQAGALSPDGTRVAFGTSQGTTVVDLTSGRERRFPTPATTRPVWLDSRSLLLGPDALVDPVTGQARDIPSGPDDVVTPRRPHGALRDPVSRVVELISHGQVRLRRWTSSLPRPLPYHVPLTGQLTELVGQWRGPGFGYDGEDGLIVRVCRPAPVPSVAYASAMVAVVRPRTGRVERALLVDSALSGSVRLIGWADARRVLISLVRPGRQQIVAWDLARGGLAVSSSVNCDGVVSLPDIGSVM